MVDYCGVLVLLGIRIICVGKLKERFYTDAAKEYIKRLSGYCKLEIIEIPEYRLPTGSAEGTQSTIHNSQFTIENMNANANIPNTQVAIALNKERVAIEAKIPDGAVCIALCVEGREMDSPGLSGFLSDCAIHGASRLCFIIGGSFGLHENIKNMANIRLSMSKMTFPHSLARIMLLEQLYRAFNITEGGKYHK